MKSNEEYRKKTAMLVYAIELGCSKFIKKEKADSDKYLPTLMFGDILKEFSLLSPQGNTAAYPRELKSLADALELATVRNVCAHPVRDFDSHAWFKACAFASDPRLQALGITEPVEALASAEANTISAPPEEWMEKYSYSPITNNLPNQESYDLTGLVGRDRDIARLTKEILTGRNNTLTLTGQGGVGKTSLAIEIARTLSNNLEAKTRFDCIVFSSLKREFLAADGFKKTGDTQSSVALMNEMLFEELAELYGFSNSSDQNTKNELQDLLRNEKILIILDNLEELVLTNPQGIEEVLGAFPREWFVLLTSRIPIDGAKNEPLLGLTEGAMESLARKYHKKVLGKDISNNLLKDVTTTSQGNPLALKLIIDRIHLGHSQRDAKKTTSEDIAEFSFKYLIDAINPNEQKILECAFAIGSTFREDLLHITKLREEDLSLGLSRLYRTSLLIKDEMEGRECYKLSTAIRELMGKNPINLEARKQFRRESNAQKILQSKPDRERKKNAYSYDDATPSTLKETCLDLFRLWISSPKRSSRTLSETQRLLVLEIEKNLDASQITYSKFSDYWKMKSVIKVLLEDHITSLDHAEQAYHTNPESLSTVFFYSDKLISAQEHERASKVLEPVIQLVQNNYESALETYEVVFLSKLFANYFKTFIFRDLNEVVVEMTNQWQKIPLEIQSTFCISRCSALRRLHENSRVEDSVRHKDLMEAARIMKFILQDSSTPVHVYEKELAKLINVMAMPLSSANGDNLDYAGERLRLVHELGDLSGLRTDMFTESHATERHSAEEESYEVPPESFLAEVIYATTGYAYVKNGEGDEFFLPYSFLKNQKRLLTGIPLGRTVRAWNVGPPNISGGKPIIRSAILE